MYGKLAGMTGTADTEAYEFKEIYNLETVVIPPNRISQRKDRQDQIYKTSRERYDAVIKDIAKTLVYRLCAYRNSIKPVIPERILTRAPSAELRPDQTDQDSLPSYEVLDGIVERYMEQNQSIEQMIAAGFDAESVEKVTRLIKLNEYKRRQAPPGVRVTTRAFGRDWRYPITSQFRA
jgi:hypothetical protein